MNQDYESATKALSGKTSGKLKTASIHVRKGHKGGYIAKHHLEDAHGNAHHKTPEYPLATLQQLQAHMKEHMGEESQEAAPDQEPDGEDQGQ